MKGVVVLLLFWYFVLVEPRTRSVEMPRKIVIIEIDEYL